MTGYHDIGPWILQLLLIILRAYLNGRPTKPNPVETKGGDPLETELDPNP